MAKNYSDQDEAIAEINVVPLVDIILVVLIIFMVTAPMIMKPNIKVNLPKAASGEQSQPTQLSITLFANGILFLNGQKSTEEAIKNKAIEELKKNSDVQAIIAADKDVPHGKVIGILDIIKLTGVKKFAISIEKAQ